MKWFLVVLVMNSGYPTDENRYPFETREACFAALETSIMKQNEKVDETVLVFCSEG